MVNWISNIWKSLMKFSEKHKKIISIICVITFLLLTGYGYWNKKINLLILSGFFVLIGMIINSGIMTVIMYVIFAGFLVILLEVFGKSYYVFLFLFSHF